MERKTVQGLRSILEGILLESMYTIPSTPDVAKIVVDESVVRGDSEPLLVYETPVPLQPARKSNPSIISSQSGLAANLVASHSVPI